jgi:hypothetical protein
MAGQRIRRLLVVGLIAVLAAPLPASAAPARDPEQRRAQGAATAQRLLDGPGAAAVGGRVAQHQSVTDILGAVRDHRDTAGWMGAVAEVMGERFSTPVATSSSSPCCDDEDEPYTGSRASAAGAGDLDGDGGGDILVYHRNMGDHSTVLEARRGTDAQPRWERAMAGDESIAMPLQTDLDGDGGHDVMELTLDILEESYDCDGDDWQECYGGTYTATYRWQLSALSGADGSPLWTRTYDGELSEGYSESYEETARFVYDNEYAYWFTGTNVGVVPLLTDTDADGASEVLVNDFDFDAREEGSGTSVYPWFAGAGLYDGSFQLRAVTDVELLDGDSGASSASFSEASPGMLPVMYPLEQPGGDDLVWERLLVPDEQYRCIYGDAFVLGAGRCTGAAAEVAVNLTLLDGRTHAQGWSQDFAGWGFSYAAGGDFDADGRGDLVVLTEGAEDYSSTFVTSGTGAALWSAPLDTVAVGPLDNVPGDDLVTVAYSYEEQRGLPLVGEWTFTETMTVERVNGTTGKAFASQSLSGSGSDSEEGFSYTYPYVAGGPDGDGDGSPDITMGLITFQEHYSDDDWHYTVEASKSEAQSGATSAVLYTAPAGQLLWPEGDADGDRLTDLAQTRLSSGDAGETVSYGMVRMVDGGVLWTSGDTGHSVDYRSVGDLDGDGGIDILRHVDTVTTARHRSTAVTAMNGASGADGWTFSSRP